MSKIVVKKTQELTAADWEQIVSGFNEEFEREKSRGEMEKFYQASVTGYCYHALYWEGEELAGYNTLVPYHYNVKDAEPVLCCLSGGTFVRKKYRSDIFILKDMYSALAEVAAAAGCVAVLGVPNKNSYQYFVRLLKFKFLYALPYYVLPVKLSTVLKKPILKFADFFYKPSLWLVLQVYSLFSKILDAKEKQSYFNVQFPPEVFERRFGNSYTKINQGGTHFCYKVSFEKGLNIAYILEFGHNSIRTKKALASTCKYILNNEKVDMIAFVGKLDLSQLVLLHLPEKMEPQKLNLIVQPLVAEDYPLFEQILKPENWNFGLMNFDVR